MQNYSKQTTNSPNPIARFAHNMRIRRSVDLTLKLSIEGNVLDYGAGFGFFISKILDKSSRTIIGYEPYRAEEYKKDLPIYSDLEKVIKKAPFNLVTIFETVEHLTNSELKKFLDLCKTELKPANGILFSAPIEIGPGLILKEINRTLFRLRKSENSFTEFIKASLFGIAAAPSKTPLNSHKGFDFRKAIKFIESCGWSVEILGYGPLPIPTWYGNSQVYFQARLSNNNDKN